MAQNNLLGKDYYLLGKNYTKALLAKAIALASEKFLHKTDRGGQPYILHCLEVMNGVKEYGPEVMAIAVLHDIIEDTNVTITTLSELG